MEQKHRSALIVAYYLSKFDRVAYEKLGYPTMIATHNAIGHILDVKPLTVRNMRDQFDPLHENPRVGWYQAPLGLSRTSVVEILKDMEEKELRNEVFKILKR
jgi:hypothetical protein